MKKVLYLCTIVFMIFAAVAPAAAAPAGDDNGPQRPQQPELVELKWNYLPLASLVKEGPFAVSGLVMDEFNSPIAGATVADNAGHSAVTNRDGRYVLTLDKGTYRLTAAHPEYNVKMRNGAKVSDAFAVSGDLNDRNFTMVAKAAAPNDIVEQFRNTDFEVNDYWNPVSGMAVGFTPYYYIGRSHATGTRSGITGVPLGTYLTRASTSRYRSQTFVIPADATSAYLKMYFWSQTADTGDISVTPTASMQSLSDKRKSYPNVSGLNTDNAESAEVQAAFDNRDRQYVFLIDGLTNNAIGNPIIMDLYGNNTDTTGWWTFDEEGGTNGFDLLAHEWGGETITDRPLKIEFGTFNDADPYKTLTWFDDVSLLIDAASLPTPNPNPIVCADRADLLLNNGFETVDSDWLSVGPEYYEPDWAQTPEITPFAGSWSYRTGIPWNIVNEYPNEWQWSEGYQPIDLTAETEATRIRVSYWVLPRSAFANTVTPGNVFVNDSYSQNAGILAQWDSQYVYLKGPTGRDEIDRLVEKWWAWNSAWWQYRTIDITAYKGQVLSVVFGTANNGIASNSSLYVDEVYVNVCAPEATE